MDGRGSRLRPQVDEVGQRGRIGRIMPHHWLWSEVTEVRLERMLDLYHYERRINSVYWNGHWNLVGNQFH